jgi:hypothetical protein
LSVVAPPPVVPREPDELEALIREARARQRRRQLIGASVAGVAAAVALGVNGLTAGGQGTTRGHGTPPAAVKSGSACGVRGLGIRLLGRDGRTLYRELGRWAHPNRGYPSTIRCSGPSVWAVFVDGEAAPGEGAFAVHSSDRGRTWRPVFTAWEGIVNAPHSFDPYLGAWTLTSKAAYFVGWSLTVADRTLEPSTSLYVTKDSGRTFRRYAVPALLGYVPTAIRVAGDRVTIAARGAGRRRTSTIRIA